MAATEPTRRPRTRALTLIEVLVALGIVLALGMLVLPLTSWALSLRALESARDGVEAIILQSRAHARVSARAIEVRVSGHRLEASWFDPTLELTDSSDGAESLLAVDQADQTGVEDSMIPESWARRRLPSDVEAVSWEDYRVRAEAFDGLENTWADPFQESEDISMRLAVLLPDGGALVGDPIVLIGPDGAVLRINVDRWTGRPQIDVPPADLFDLPEDETEEEQLAEEELIEPLPEEKPETTIDRSEKQLEFEELDS